jgi:hypothetical protein
MAVDTGKLTNKVSKLLIEVISHHVREHTVTVLKGVATDYEIPFDELMEKYGALSLSFDVSKPKKKASHSTEPKKRGRKKKQKEEMIETEEYEFEGTTYLVDKDNNVYTYDVESPMHIGTKLIDGRIKLIKVNT